MSPTFKLNIDCGNAAFAEGGNAELARILTKIASDLDMGRDCEDLPQSIYDINGNRVGTYVTTTEERAA